MKQNEARRKYKIDIDVEVNSLHKVHDGQCGYFLYQNEWEIITDLPTELEDLKPCLDADAITIYTGTEVGVKVLPTCRYVYHNGNWYQLCI